MHPPNHPGPFMVILFRPDGEIARFTLTLYDDAVRFARLALQTVDGDAAGAALFAVEHGLPVDRKLRSWKKVRGHVTEDAPEIRVIR